MRLFALLALEDGSYFEGTSVGYFNPSNPYSVGEVVFNTSMTGYQEILSDPSYAEQFISLTYPHIGNVGINQSDKESDVIFAKGLIIRQLPQRESNWRKTHSLGEYLQEHKVPAIADIDTRRLTRLIREKGSLKGCLYITDSLTTEIIEHAIQLAQSFKGLKGMDLAQQVTTSKPYRYCTSGKWHVVAYDFGIKKTILECLKQFGCKVTVVPAKTDVEEVLALSPDGVFLSNGPGDPEPCDYAIKAIQNLLMRNIPLFGICLGHQLLALACGASTLKMKCGHHGGNHPVQRLNDKTVMITSQNHGFAVDDNALPDFLEVTHRSLFDNTIQGIKHRKVEAFGFQGHPEAGPGPHDARDLFQQFIDAMEKHRQKHSQEALVAMEIN